MTTITGTVTDVSDRPSTASVIFASPVVRGTTGKVIDVRERHVYPNASGQISVNVQPGLCEIRVAAQKYLVDVPASGPVDLWDLIRLAVDVPPVTSAGTIAAAVAAYMMAHPVVGGYDGGQL